MFLVFPLSVRILITDVHLISESKPSFLVSPLSVELVRLLRFVYCRTWKFAAPLYPPTHDTEDLVYAQVQQCETFLV